MRISLSDNLLVSPSPDGTEVLRRIKATHKDKPRNTFGIINPLTKRKYRDIIKSHLELRRLLFEEWYLDKKIQESEKRKQKFILLLDHKTAKDLIREGILDVMISFQERVDGFYAVARTFDGKRVKQRTEE